MTQTYDAIVIGAGVMGAIQRPLDSYTQIRIELIQEIENAHGN